MSKEINEYTEYVGFKAEVEIVKEVDTLAKSLGLNRSQCVRNLVAAGLDDARIARRLGLVSIISLIRQSNVPPRKVVNMVLDSEEKTG